MTNFLQSDNSLPPGKYTLQIKGFTRVGAASKKSGFDKTNNVYASKLKMDQIVFDANEGCRFVIKKNDTNEEMAFRIISDGNIMIIYSETPLESDYENEEFMDREFGSDIESNRIISISWIEMQSVLETSEYYFEEVCSKGTVEYSFEVLDYLYFDNIDCSYYEDMSPSGNNYFELYLNLFAHGEPVVNKGDGSWRSFWIEEDEIDSENELYKIRAFLGGKNETAFWTDQFDGFVIEDGVITEYKGYSDKIVIPPYVTEIADNIFLFPVESIEMPNKNIKVGINFPWDKVK